MMQTPTANGQEQGSDMATDRSTSGTNKDVTSVETPNSTSQSAELPRESCGDTKGGVMLRQSHDDGGNYGLQTPAELPREGQNDPERGAMIEESHIEGNLYDLQAPVGEVENEELRTLGKTVEHATQKEAQYTTTKQTQTFTIETSAPTTLSVRVANEVSNTSAPLPLEPPITKAALAELEVANIIYNPTFRYDINFNDGIYYKPNFDGEKGEQKRLKADKFWYTLYSQISEFMSSPEAFQAKHHSETWTLPAILKAISEILITLVPSTDRSTIDEALNIDLLMQQFSKSVADLEQLAQWFSRTLRTHCAPMRDTWVYNMVNKLTTGKRNGDVAILVEGIQMLLGIVEAMRLDVTNHQIRCLKPVLIQDTVEFQQSAVLKRIARGYINVFASHAWFKSYRDSNAITTFSHEGGIWTFLQGFVDLLRLSNADKPTPDTLEFDNKRIADLRSDVLDVINLEVCMRFVSMLMSMFHPVKQHKSNGSLTTRATLVANATLDAGHPNKSPLGHNPALAPTGDKFNDNSIPMRIGHNFASLQANLNAQNHNEADLRSTLLAILDGDSSFAPVSPSHPPSSPMYCDRWKNAAPSLALEIIRHAAVPLSDTSLFEKTLKMELSSFSSEIFRSCEAAVLGRLGQFIQNYVTVWEHLGNFALFEIAAKCPKNQWPPNTPMAVHNIPIPHGNELLGSIARRVAHMGILHWRIWSKIAYMVDPNDQFYYGLETDQDTGEIDSD